MLKDKSNADNQKLFQVEVFNLVHFIDNLEANVKVIKMDVEGVECKIINKLIDTGIIKKIGLLLAETHDEKIPKLKEETDKLRQRIKDEKLKNINLNWI